LTSALDASALVDFFLNHYRPTPIVAPWNGKSGFYLKDRTVGIDAIASSSDERFTIYRKTISVARAIPEVAQAKGDSKSNEDMRRVAVLRACRNSVPDECVDWLDAVVGLSADGKRAFAPILGTGGNEGRLDYTNNFMENLANLLIKPDSKTPVQTLLQNALFGEASDGLQLLSVGQYDPGRSGGFNQGSGVTSSTPVNPWNFVLTLEGAVVWAAGIYRRQGVSFRSFLCSPFTVRSVPVGYGSAAQKDGATARAEIWTPLWVRPARYAEVKNLLREGRASIDARPAETGLEFAQAATTLGVDRGITGFVRYNLLKRRGDSYIALPTGRFPVTHRRETDLVRELTPLLNRADSFLLRDAPASYESLRRQVDEAIYQVLLRGGPEALCSLAASFGRLQRWILNTAKPVRLGTALSPSWLESLVNIPEARIAAALAWIWNPTAGRFREHLDRSSSKFAWMGNDLPARLIRVLERRLVEGADAPHNPVRSRYEITVTDAALFIDASVDDDLIEDLLFTFSLLGRDLQCLPHPARNEIVDVWPVYALIKHLFLSRPVSTPSGSLLLRADPRILQLLSRGDIRAAAEIALSRLQIAGLTPVQAQYTGGIDARRLAAALLIPVSYSAKLSNSVLNNTTANS
jgi:CRISPR-associated protein Csx17